MTWRNEDGVWHVAERVARFAVESILMLSKGNKLILTDEPFNLIHSVYYSVNLTGKQIENC
jgi:hypothetical protein